jgi:hypothetical protein
MGSLGTHYPSADQLAPYRLCLHPSSRLAGARHADANEIRLRAERRLGEMMAAQPKAPGGRPYQSTGFSKNPVTDKLATFIDAGIDPNLAHRSRGTSC